MDSDSLEIGSKPSASEAVIRSVADHTNTDPTDLPALYHTIDPDALDATVQGTGVSRVVFAYADLEITVTGPQDVTVRDPGPAHATDGQAD